MRCRAVALDMIARYVVPCAANVEINQTSDFVITNHS